MTDTSDALDEYKASIPHFEDWQSASCVGYFGYGNGRAAPHGREVANATRQEVEMPCNSCPKNLECWDKTKEAAAQLMPESVKEFERIARFYRGNPEKMWRAWARKVGGPNTPRDQFYLDPYMFVSIVNTEQAIVHEHESEAS